MTGNSLEGPVARYLTRWLTFPLAGLAARTALTPGQASFISSIIALAAFGLFAADINVAAGVLILVVLAVDGVNIGLAHAKGRDSRFGAVWDLFLARYGDAAIIGGMALWASQHEERTWPALVGLLALSGVLALGYLQARIAASAPTAGLSLWMALGSRDVRLLVAAVGAIVGEVYYALALLGALSFVAVGGQLVLLRRRLAT